MELLTILKCWGIALSFQWKRNVPEGGIPYDVNSSALNVTFAPRTTGPLSESVTTEFSPGKA
jgi:hypothetical protein